MNAWLEKTFADADVHAEDVSFEYPAPSEVKWINGTAKALSPDYAGAFRAVTVDICVIGKELAKKPK